MLSRRLRLQVDRLWDTARANGVTNPVACVEVLTTVLLARSVPALRTAITNVDARAIAAAVDDLLAKVDAGAHATHAETGALLARHHELAVELLAQGDALDVDERDDLLGDVFEHVLQRMATAGHFGQFRTPRHLVDFVVSLVDPRPDDDVLDPASGTGGFLIGAAQHAVVHHGASPQCLRGEEIDGSVARLGRLNLVTHGLAGGATAATSASVAVTDGLVESSPASVILANPPFGGTVRPEVATRFASASPKTELLFLERILDRLADGGRAGVIVPWGVIANRTQGADAIRRRLLDDNDLRAVIELPAGAFGPYTDIRTAVLVWHGGGTSDAVFFGRARADGFSLDDRREPTEANDLPGLLAAYQQGDVDLVDASEVRARGCSLAPSRYVAATSATPPHRSATRGQDGDDLGVSVAALASTLRELTDVVVALEGTEARR